MDQSMFRSFLLTCLLPLLPTLLWSQTAPHNPVNPEKVTIARDSFGVPHIFGPTDREVAYGLAWAHAEDDFKTIQETMLMAKGMLGRVKGADGAKIDYVQQLLRLDREAAAGLERDISPEFRHYLAAYCQGLNDYARLHPKECLHKKLFPISPEDNLKGYALSIGLLSGLARTLPKILDGTIENEVVEVSFGSNAFAFRKEMSKDNKTMLIVNAHQPIEGQVAFYEAHLHSEEGMNIHGGTFPGGVSIFHGVNPYLGWAHTANSFDKLDVYKLEMHPEEKNQYRFDNQWLELEEEKAKLKVKLAGITIGLKKKIWWSVYGPTLKTEKGVYAIRLAANQRFGAAEEWYRMARAKNIGEFKKALEMDQLPVMNITYADRENNIWFINHGIVPKRKKGYDWKKVLPGNTSETLWEGFYSLDAMPQVLNPNCGYLFCVNQPGFNVTCPESNPDPRDYPTQIAGYKLRDNNRSIRFRELYPETKPISMEELKQIKWDYYLPQKSVFMKNVDRMMNLDTNRFADVADIVREFAKWDRSMAPESSGASIFLLAVIPIFKAYDFSPRPFRIELGLSDEDLANCLRNAKTHLKKYFGKLTVPFGKLMRHRRGKKDYPIGGFPDVMAAMMGKPEKDGTFTAFHGDDLIMYVQFDEQGVSFETCRAYGNSARPGASHYNDQMEIMLNHQGIPRTLDKTSILKKAERIYHPGIKK